MSRISIDVTEDEQKALAELESFLDERLRKARAGKISRRKVGEIFKQAYREVDV